MFALHYFIQSFVHIKQKWEPMTCIAGFKFRDTGEEHKSEINEYI